MNVFTFRLLVLASLCFAVAGCSDKLNSENKGNQESQDRTEKQNKHVLSLVNPNTDRIKTTDQVKKYLSIQYNQLVGNSDSSKSWGRFGDVLSANLFYEESIAAYEKAATLDVNSPRWFSRLSVSFYVTGQVEDALIYIYKASSLAPNSLLINFFKARIHEDLGQLTEAEDVYKNLHKRYPEIAEINFAYARVLFNSGKHNESLLLMQKADELAPNSVLVNSYMLRFSRIFPNLIAPSDDPKQLNSTTMELPRPFERESMIHARTMLGLRAFVSNLLMSGEQILAGEFSSLLVELYPDQATEQEWVASLDYITKMNKQNKAVVSYKSGLTFFPDSTRLQLGLADVYSRLKNFTDAQNLYNIILISEVSLRDEAMALQGLARIKASKGELSESLIQMLSASEKWPENGVIHLDLVRIYADLKQFDKANIHLRLAEANGQAVTPMFKQQLARAESSRL